MRIFSTFVWAFCLKLNFSCEPNYLSCHEKTDCILVYRLLLVHRLASLCDRA